MELLVLSQFNLDSPLPTFFELYAQEKLVQTLQAVFRYLHTTLGERVPVVATYLPYNDEVFWSMWVLLEHRFLTHMHATFSENFYGLKRVVLQTPAAKANGQRHEVDRSVRRGNETSSAASGGADTVTPKQVVIDGSPKQYDFRPLAFRERLVSLLAVTLFPYLKAKAHQYYRNAVDESEDAVLARAAYDRRWPLLQSVRTLFVKVFPYLNLVWETSVLLHYVLYLFEHTAHYHPLLRLQGVVIRRMEGADYMKLQTSATQQRLARLGRSLIMGIVFGFRLMEWWNTTSSASTSLMADTHTIPPPPQPLPAKVELPEDPSACPVCRRAITNPAVNIASGYTFCYPCIRQAVTETGKCPVAQVYTTGNQIRRIFETA